MHEHTVCNCVAFITKHSYKASCLCGDVASREGVGGTLVVMPLGTQSRDDPRLETVATLVKALRAFCHPLAWDTLHLRALQASMLRMFPTVTVADGGGRALQAAAVLDSASRNVARGAVASIVVSFTDVADERCVPACDSVFLSLFSRNALLLFHIHAVLKSLAGLCSHRAAHRLLPHVARVTPALESSTLLESFVTRLTSNSSSCAASRS